jgi:hypothetical protein
MKENIVEKEVLGKLKINHSNQKNENELIIKEISKKLINKKYTSNINIYVRF